MSGTLFSDPEYLDREEREARENYSPAGLAPGAWAQAGMGLLRGGALAADALRMAEAVPVIAFNDDETQDAYFKATDEVIDSAVSRWTPDPDSTTFAGRVMGGVAEAVLPLMLGGGNPAVLMASYQNRTSRDLVKQGVDASTARDTGMIDAATIGAGFMIPMLGTTLSRRVAFGAAINPALGAVSTGIKSAALEEAGYGDVAKQFDPWDLEARGIDALLGAAFGGIVHAGGAKAPELGAPLDIPGRSVMDDLDGMLAYQGAQRWDSRALGAPTIANKNAHDTAMRAAMEQAIRGEPIDVTAYTSPDVMAYTLDDFPASPQLDPAAIAADIVDDVFRPTRRPADTAPPQDALSWLDEIDTDEQRAALASFENRKKISGELVDQAPESDGKSFATHDAIVSVARAGRALAQGDASMTALADVIEKAIPGASRLFDPHGETDMAFVGDAAFIPKSEVFTLFSRYIRDMFDEGLLPELPGFVISRNNVDAFYSLGSKSLGVNGSLEVLRRFEADPRPFLTEIAAARGAFKSEAEASLALSEFGAIGKGQAATLQFLDSPKGRRAKFSVVTSIRQREPAPEAVVAETAPAAPEAVNTRAENAMSEINALVAKYPDQASLSRGDQYRAKARVTDRHFDELSPATQDFLINRPAFDAETGETHRIGQPSEIGGGGEMNIHGTHIYNLEAEIQVDAEARQRAGATGGARPGEKPGGEPKTGEAKPAGEDIDLDLLQQARELAATTPDAPIQMIDDLESKPAAQALADADREIAEAETTYARAAEAAAGCLLG